MLGREDVLKFGKYKGITVQQVLNVNPGYLLWVQDTINWVNIHQKILNEARRRQNERQQENRSFRNRIYIPKAYDHDYDYDNPMDDYARDVAYGIDD